MTNTASQITIRTAIINDRQVFFTPSENEWLSLRREDLTSTSISALFDLSPYITKFELYHAKKSGLELEFEVTDRMKKGSRLESYAAQEVGLKLGMEVRPFKDYIRIPSEGIGSSFDWEILCPNRGWGLLEIKGVDYFQFKQKWTEEETPAHIEIQLQHQLEVANRHSWGVIAPFTSIYDFHTYERPRDYDMGKALRKEGAKFWESIKIGIEPKPDFNRDSDAINALYKENNQPIIDATNNIELESSMAEFKRINTERKECEKLEEAAKAKIWYLLGESSGAYGNKYKVIAGRTKDSPGKLITPDMVGTYVGGRKGYRQCQVKDLTIQDDA